MEIYNCEVCCEKLSYVYSIGVIVNYKLTGKVCYKVVNPEIYEIQSKSISMMFPRVVEATIGKYLQTLQGTNTDPIKVIDKKQEISEYVKNNSERLNKNFGIEVTDLEIDSFELIS